MRTHVNFTRVNKIEAMYERPCVNVRVERGSTVAFTRDLPYIASDCIYARTHVKITRQWKSTLRGCLHDTGATFVPERVHSGSLSWLYICLHDTTTNFMLARVTPARVHPGSCTGARISLLYEISQRYHVNTKQPPVSV